MKGVEATIRSEAPHPRGWRQVRIATAFGHTRVLALATETPGLVVHTPIDSHDGAHWVVTHERSGYAVARFVDQDGALEFCGLAREMTDWTLARSALPRNQAFRNTVRQAAKLCGAVWPLSLPETGQWR